MGGIVAKLVSDWPSDLQPSIHCIMTSNIGSYHCEK